MGDKTAYFGPSLNIKATTTSFPTGATNEGSGLRGEGENESGHLNESALISALSSLGATVISTAIGTGEALLATETAVVPFSNTNAPTTLASAKPAPNGGKAKIDISMSSFVAFIITSVIFLL